MSVENLSSIDSMAQSFLESWKQPEAEVVVEDDPGRLVRQGRSREADTVDTWDRNVEVLDTLDKEDLEAQVVLEDLGCLADLAKSGLVVLEGLEDLEDQRDHHYPVDLDSR